MKRYVSGLPIVVDRKNQSHQRLKTGMIIITANEPLSYRLCKNQANKGGLARRVIEIPIKKLNKKEETNSKVERPFNQ